jgi:tripartite motif-containing protein 71
MIRSVRPKRLLVSGVILGVMLLLAGSVQAATYVRTVGSSGHSEMYPSGLDVDASGALYVADTGNDQIEKYAPGSSTPAWVVGKRGATIQDGSFSNPRDVAAGSTYVFVADTDQYMVQVLDKSSGSFVAKLAFVFRSPIGVSVGTDGSGHQIVLVSDGGTGRVEVFEAGGSFAHIASIPPRLGSNAGTRDAATDASGNLYAADYRDHAVQKYSVAGAWPNLTYTWVKQWGGKGSAFPTCQQIPHPYGVDFDDAGRVYVATSDQSLVKVFDSNGACVTGGTYGVHGTGSNQIGALRRVAVTSGSAPKVLAADLWGLKILEYDPGVSHTVPVARWGSGSYPPRGLMNEVHSVSVSPDGRWLYAADTINQRAERYDLSGCAAPPSTSCPSVAWGGKGVGKGAFNWPQGIGVNPTNGHVWVVDTRNNRLQEYSVATNGDVTLLRVLGGTRGTAHGQFYWPMSVAFDPSGNMYVADTFNSRVQSFTPTLAFRWAYGTLGTGTSNLRRPNGIAYDAAGLRVLIADTLNKRIVALDPSTGARTAIPVSGVGLTSPYGVAADPIDGTIWVADAGNNRIQEFSGAGASILTIGGPGYGSGPTQFNFPTDLAFGANGSRVFVADTYNDRVQVLSP